MEYILEAMGSLYERVKCTLYVCRAVFAVPYVNVIWLELCSMANNVGKRCKDNGWEVFSVGIGPKAKPTLRNDMLQIGRSDLPEHVAAVWASFLCTLYSIA